jgi:hypothetical protein
MASSFIANQPIGMRSNSRLQPTAAGGIMAPPRLKRRRQTAQTVNDFVVPITREYPFRWLPCR